MTYTDQEQSTLAAVKEWERKYHISPEVFMETYVDDFLIECPLQEFTLNDKVKFARGESAMLELFKEAGIKIEWMTAR